MKKIISMMLLCTLMVGFCSCTKDEDSSSPLKGTL